MALTYDIPFYLRWTVDELKDMIALLKRADFDPTDINTDAQLRSYAYSDFGEINLMFSWVIPCNPRLSHIANGIS